MNKKVVIPLAIISFVAIAGYLKYQNINNPTTTPGKRVWLKSYLNKSDLDYNTKMEKSALIDTMQDTEIEVLYNVIKNNPVLENAPSELLVQFEAIDQKYNLFS